MPYRSRATLADVRQRLQAFQGQARIGSGDLRGELAATLGAVAMRETLAGFRNSETPYGEAWAPVARGGKPLIDTGALRASLTFEVTADGFQIGLADRVSVFHQYGTRARPRHRSFAAIRAARRRGLLGEGSRVGSSSTGGITPRPMLPTADRGMPPQWRRSFEGATRSVLRRFSEARA